MPLQELTRAMPSGWEEQWDRFAYWDDLAASGVKSKVERPLASTVVHRQHPEPSCSDSAGDAIYADAG